MTQELAKVIQAASRELDPTTNSLRDEDLHNEGEEDMENLIDYNAWEYTVIPKQPIQTPGTFYPAHMYYTAMTRQWKEYFVRLSQSSQQYDKRFMGHCNVRNIFFLVKLRQKTFFSSFFTDLFLISLYFLTFFSIDSNRY